MLTIRFKSTVEELSTFPVIDHFWHETSASQKGLSHPITGVSSGGSHGPELWSCVLHSGNDAGDLKCNDSKSEFEEFALH